MLLHNECSYPESGDADSDILQNGDAISIIVITLAEVVSLQEYDSAHRQEHRYDLQGKVYSKIESNTDQYSVVAEELSQRDRTVYFHNAGNGASKNGYKNKRRCEIIISIHINEQSVKQGT